MRLFAGWDVGGAHLKMALLDEHGLVLAARQRATPLWHGDSVLREAIDALYADTDGGNCTHYITLTAELVDRYRDRRQGMHELSAILRSRFPGNTVFYTPQGMLSWRGVEQNPEQAMSANWHATATLAAEWCEQGILLDIGSTSSDLTALVDGKPAPAAFTDQARLRCGELVYSGVVRTPVMALCQRVPFAGHWQSLANEHFATTADIHRVAGGLDEADDQQASADGSGKSETDSMRRLARMLGQDYSTDASPALRELAHYLSCRQLTQLEQALALLLSRRPAIAESSLLGTGCGRFLAARLATLRGFTYHDLAQLAGVPEAQHSAVNRCAAAFAVAWLGHRTHGLQPC